MNKVTIQYSKEAKLVCILLICPFDQMGMKIPVTFAHFKSRLNEIDEIINPLEIFGFYPQASSEPDSTKCYYYFGVEVEKIAGDPPNGMIVIDIPASRYVSYTFKGQIDRFVEDAYTKVNQYIESENLIQDRNSYVIEKLEFGNDLSDIEKNDNKITLMIPIK